MTKMDLQVAQLLALLGREFMPTFSEMLWAERALESETLTVQSTPAQVRAHYNEWLRATEE
jgi:hypothetical protein